MTPASSTPAAAAAVGPVAEAVPVTAPVAGPVEGPVNGAFDGALEGPVVEAGRSAALGLLFVVLSSAFFATSGVFAAALIDAGWTPAAAVTARVGVAALLLTVPGVLAVRGRWHVLRRGVRSVLAYGVIAVAAPQLAFFNAVAHLDVGVALLIEYLGIVLVVGWMWLRHGQRPGAATVAGAAASVTGLVLVLDVFGAVSVDVVGLLWGLAAATGLAAYFILSAHVDPDLPPLTLAWGGLTVGTAALGAAGAAGVIPMAATRAPVTLLGHSMSWFWAVVGLSLVAAVLSYVTGIVGARIVGARLAMFIGLTEVLFAVVFAWLALGQALSPLQVIGGLVVVAGIALVKYAES